mgnify:CR=1 FL=1
MLVSVQHGLPRYPLVNHTTKLCKVDMDASRENELKILLMAYDSKEMFKGEEWNSQIEYFCLCNIQSIEMLHQGDPNGVEKST